MIGPKLRQTLLLCLLGLVAFASGQAFAQAPARDAYSYCSTDGATNYHLDAGFTSDWTVFVRPPGAYPDGSVEGTSASNAYSSGGVLHLVAQKSGESAVGNFIKSNSYLSRAVMHSDYMRQSLSSSFMSGRVISRQPIRFGCLEFTARLPSGRGYWPALWMRTPYGQPTDGEVDILEGFGSHPGVFQSTLHHWHNNVQPSSSNRRIINGVDRTYTCARVAADTPRPAAETQDAIKKARWAGTDKWHLPNWQFASAENPCVMAPVSPSVSFSQGFHRFMVVWMPDRMIWVLDGKTYFETNDDVPQKAMNIVMNLSVGKMDGDADASTPLVGELQIKSVRLMKLRH